MIKKYQYIILSFFLTRVLFSGSGISLLIQISQENVVISSILGTLLGSFLLYIYYHKDNLNHKILCLLSFSILFITIISNTILIDDFLLSKTPSWIILFSFIFLLLYSSKNDINSSCHIGTLSLPVTIFTIVICLIGLVPLMKVDNLLPIFNIKIKNFIKAILIFAVITISPNIVLLSKKNNLKFKDVLLGYLLGSLFIIIYILAVILVYGVPLASIIRYPEYAVLKKIYFFRVFGNIENILVLEWIISGIISSIFLVNFLKNNINKLFVILFIILFVGVLLCINCSYTVLLIIKQNCWLLFLALEIILFFTHKKKVTK